MNMIPIESKQIAFVEYDDDKRSLLAHFTSGEVREYSVSREEYASLLDAPNKYDLFVKMTSGRESDSNGSGVPYGNGAPQ